MGSPLTRPAVRTVLDSARLGHLAVETALGPHVTPALAAAAAGRLWLVSARGTVKVRAMRRRPRVSLLVEAGETAVVVGGDAAVLGPWPPGDALRLARTAGPAAQGLLRYSARNAGALAGFALDVLHLEPGSLPHDRVLVAVTPRWLVVLDGGRVVDHWGPVPRRRGRPATSRRAGAGVAGALALVPGDVRRRVRGRAVTVALEGGEGPVALPATAGADGTVHLHSAAVRATGASMSGRACLTLSGGDPDRPSRTAGVVVRGAAAGGGGAGASIRLDLEVRRVSWWLGFRQGGATLAGRRTTTRRRPARRQAAA